MKKISQNITDKYIWIKPKNIHIKQITLSDKTLRIFCLYPTFSIWTFFLWYCRRKEGIVLYWLTVSSNTVQRLKYKLISNWAMLSTISKATSKCRASIKMSLSTDIWDHNPLRVIVDRPLANGVVWSLFGLVWFMLYLVKVKVTRRGRWYCKWLIFNCGI